MLDAEDIRSMREQIVVAAWGGFEDEDEVEEWVEAELGADDVALGIALKAYIAREFREHGRREAAWREATTNDAIDRAFDELGHRGVIALQNAGSTLSDGWSDVHETASGLPTPARGAVFYHGQDLESGVAGGGLMLAFGAFEEDPVKRDAAGVAIAREVCEVLAAHGVRVKWDGDARSRIEVRPFPWRKRRWTEAPPVSTS